MLSAPILLAQEPGAPAPEPQPDRIVLVNGDVITGTFKGLNEGTVKFESPILDKLEIDLEKISDIQTTTTVTILTVDKQKLERRITGFDGANLRLSDEVTEQDFALAELARINPPKYPKYTVNVLLGAAATSGNTERRTANLEGNFTRRTERTRVTGDAQWSYAEEDSDGTGFSITQRRLQGGGQFDYFVTDPLFAFANVRALNDEFANIELRFSTGAGLGYQIIDRENLSLLTELGLNYVSENFSTPGVPVNDYIAARARYRVVWDLMDGVQLDHGTTFLSSLENSDDTILNKQTNLNVDLTDSLFTQFSWELDWDNTPAPGQEPVDQRFFLQVGHTF